MQPWCVRPSFEGTWPTLLVCTAVCPAQTNSAVFFKQRRIHKSGRKLTAVMQAVKLWHKVRMVVKQPWKEFASSLEAERRISPEAALNGQRSKPKKHWEAELEKALEAQKIRRAHRPRSGITSITSGSFPTSFCNFTWGSCFLMFFILYPVRRPSATPCPSFTDTHTQLFYTKLVHTHTTLLHTTLSNVTHNSSHKKLSRTHTQVFTHNIVTHTQCLTHTHTILSHTHTFHTWLLHTTGPPPCPLSFQPFPSHFHTCLTLLEEVDMWVFRSFNAFPFSCFSPCGVWRQEKIVKEMERQTEEIQQKMEAGDFYGNWVFEAKQKQHHEVKKFLGLQASGATCSRSSLDT